MAGSEQTRLKRQVKRGDGKAMIEPGAIVLKKAAPVSSKGQSSDRVIVQAYPDNGRIFKAFSFHAVFLSPVGTLIHHRAA